MGLGNRIKEVREKLGISQAKFSKELGVSQIAVANLESEKNYPKFTTLIDVLKILGCDANYLLQDYRDFDKFDFIFSNEDKEAVNGDLGLFEIDGIIYSRRLIFYDNKRLLIPVNQNHKTFDVTDTPYICRGVIIRKIENILE